MTEPARVGASEVERFERVELLGRGQRGSVWRARDRRLERIVALRVLPPIQVEEHRQQIIRDASAAASLNHPNISRVLEVIERGDLVMIASEFAQGQSLQTRLDEAEFSDLRDVVRFMLLTIDAVRYARLKGIRHLNLTPANIIVDGVNRPVLTDLGLAPLNAVESPVDAVESPASVETTTGSQSGSSRSDVLSLGRILYQMVTRQDPFAASTHANCFTSSSSLSSSLGMSSPRQVRPEISVDLEVICLKALSDRPDDQYLTIQHFRDDLQTCLDGDPIGVHRAHVSGRPSIKASKRFIVGLLALIALFSSSAAAVSPFLHRDGRNPVEITTVPAHAQVAVFPLDPRTGEPQLQMGVHPGQSPQTLRLAAGDYLVVAKLTDGRFHEVYRHMPRELSETPERFPHRMWRKTRRGNIAWPTITIPGRDTGTGMVRVGERESSSGSRAAGTPDSDSVRPFLIDPHEVTIVEFKRAFQAGRLQLNPAGDTQPADPSAGDELPMTGLLYDYAVLYAELVGKRLLTDREFDYAATNAGSTAYPWGNDAHRIPPLLTPVGAWPIDHAIINPDVYGLCSNAAEFTSSPFSSTGVHGTENPDGESADFVTVRGASWEANGQARYQTARDLRVGLRRDSSRSNVGFRCARSIGPRW